MRGEYIRSRCSIRPDSERTPTNYHKCRADFSESNPSSSNDLCHRSRRGVIGDCSASQSNAVRSNADSLGVEYIRRGHGAGADGEGAPANNHNRRPDLCESNTSSRHDLCRRSRRRVIGDSGAAESDAVGADADSLAVEDVRGGRCAWTYSESASADDYQAGTDLRESDASSRYDLGCRICRRRDRGADETRTGGANGESLAAEDGDGRAGKADLGESNPAGRYDLCGSFPVWRERDRCALGSNTTWADAEGLAVDNYGCWSCARSDGKCLGSDNYSRANFCEGNATNCHD